MFSEIKQENITHAEQNDRTSLISTLKVKFPALDRVLYYNSVQWSERCHTLRKMILVVKNYFCESFRGQKKGFEIVFEFHLLQIKKCLFQLMEKSLRLYTLHNALQEARKEARRISELDHEMCRNEVPRSERRVLVKRIADRCSWCGPSPKKKVLDHSCFMNCVDQLKTLWRI